MIVAFLIAAIAILLWGVSITYSTTDTAARRRIARNRDTGCRRCNKPAFIYRAMPQQYGVGAVRVERLCVEHAYPEGLVDGN